uniref:Uncharacterized protein n=1 Tax=Arundo donax TaxID=35708 RepID=A0A0A9DF62_ARUDO
MSLYLKLIHKCPKSQMTKLWTLLGSEGISLDFNWLPVAGREKKMSHWISSSSLDKALRKRASSLEQRASRSSSLTSPARSWRTWIDHMKPRAAEASSSDPEAVSSPDPHTSGPHRH